MTTRIAPDNSSTPTDAHDDALRVLVLSSDNYPPFRVDVDVLFGDEFASRGHQFDWLLQSEAALNQPTTKQWKGWNVFVGPTDLGTSLLNRLRKHYLSIRNDLRVFGISRSTSYEFIQVKDKFIAGMLGAMAAKRRGIGFIYWLSYPFPEASLHEAAIGTARYPLLYRIRGHIFHWILYRYIAKRADHIFVQSEQMKLDMLAKGIPPEQMTAVPMGVAKPTAAPEPRPIKQHQMIYVGTLLQTRKLDFLVRVLERVRRQIPDAQLLMVGPEELPGDEQLIIEEAQRLDQQSALTLTGRLPREEAFQLIAESAVCFSPFFPTPILNSTSPTKLIEYFIQQRPVVANDHPEQRQVIAASGGGFCVEYDEQGFADAAVELMSDPQRAKEMGKAGYDYTLSHRTYDVIADELEKCYLQLRDQQPVNKLLNNSASLPAPE